MYGTSITIKELSAIIRDLKTEIGDDMIDPEDERNERVFGERALPSMEITVGYDPKDKSWGVQSGDNSYTGTAYGFPIWGVDTFYRRSNSREIARDLIDQIADQLYW